MTSAFGSVFGNLNFRDGKSHSTGQLAKCANHDDDNADQDNHDDSRYDSNTGDDDNDDSERKNAMF